MKKQQLTVFSKTDFETASEGIIPFKNGKYRARLVPLKEIPYLCKFADLFENRPALVLDRSEPEDFDYFLNADTGKIERKSQHLKISPLIIKRAINQTIAAKYGDVALAGNPLALDVVDFTKLAEDSGSDYLTPAESLPRFPLECNPLNASSEGPKLFQEIYSHRKMIDSSLSGSWVLIPTDMMGLGMSMADGFLFSPKIMCKMQYIGKGPAIHKRMAKILELPTSLNLQVKNTVSADYSFFKTRNDFDFDIIPAQFYVNAQWPVGSRINFFAHPPADVTFNIKFSPGWKDPRMGNLDLANDMSYIIALGEWLADGQTQWPDTDVDGGIVADMQKFITSSKKIPAIDVDRADFTSELWPFMKECRSHATLKYVLEMLIEGIRSRKVRPAVHSTNKSTLAVMFRAAHNELPNYTLEPLFCVQILLEVGLFYMKEKLGKCFFENKFLGTRTEMITFYSDVKTAVDEAEKLYPIFLAYQTVFCLQKFIKFSSQELLAFTRTTIFHYCNSTAVDPVNELYAFLTKGIIQDHLDDTTLTDWRLHKRFYGPGKGKVRAEYVFHFSERIEWKHASNLCMIVENDEKPKEAEENKENNKKEVVENVSVKGAGDSTVLDESANEQEMEIEEEAGEKIELSTEENEQEMEIEEGADENMSEKAIIETSKLLNEVNIGEAEEEKTDFVAKDDFHGVCLSLSYLSA